MQRRNSGIRPAFRIYVVVLFGGVLLVVVPAGMVAAAAAPIETILWVVLLVAGNLLTLPMQAKINLDVSLGAPVTVAAAVVLPPPVAVLVNFLGFTNQREWRRGTSAWLILFNRSQIALSAGAAAVAADWLALGPVVNTLIAAVVYNVVNVTAVALDVRLRKTAELVKAAKSSAVPFPSFLLDFILVTLLAVLVVLAYEQVGPVAVLLLALPLWLGYSALRSARTAEDRAEQLADRVRELETLHGLGTELLGVRSPDAILGAGRVALLQALDTDDVVIAMDGEVPAQHTVVKIPGAEPAAIGFPAPLGEDAVAVADAIAGLLGMTLQRVRLEQELGEVERARTALSGQIIEEGTKERSRIALQIHDEVLPYLAAAEIQADNVRSALGGGDTGRADQLASATRVAVHDGIARLREVLEALRRQVIVPGGLHAALAEAIEELRLQQGVRGVLRAPEALPPLPLAVEILVVETVRGCLTNVARHAAADSVTVTVEAGEGSLTVEVCDDGHGFDPSQVPSGHHGLLLMAQRVELARGRFTVGSEPGVGTSVLVEVPL